MQAYDFQAGDSSDPFDDRPASADDIDLERVVWDPAYRCAVMGLLVSEPGSGMSGGE